MTESKQVFEIGLCLSGGSTKGTYTAGVLDFFMEALQEFETAKRDKVSGGGVPPWQVRLNNITSTSAGSICNFITAASVCALHEPIPANFQYNDTPPERNLLYKGWVTDFEAGMFDKDDLEGENPTVRSLLNANFLEQLGTNLLKARDASLVGAPKPPVPLWAKDMRLQVTCANVRGVPYGFNLGASFNPDHQRFRMLRHRDHVAFNTTEGVEDKSAFSLDIGSSGLTEPWNILLKCSASSASVPVVFPSQLLERPGEQYSKRLEAEPEWPSDAPPASYKFNAVDGGVFNNEPLDLCRNSMTKLEKDAEKTTGAVILIDLQGNNEPLIDLNKKIEPSSMFDNLRSLLPTLWNESSFKAEELGGIMDEDNLSEFILSPSRGTKDNMEHGALATAYLSGFSGILHAKIRHHDFMLGRYNAQAFLKEHFTIDAVKAQGNPIFSGIQTYAVAAHPEQKRIPIIPLKGTAAILCQQPEWPKLTKNDVAQVHTALSTIVHDRFRTVMYALLNSFLPPGGWFNPVRFVSTRSLRFIMNRILGHAMDRLKAHIDGILALFPESTKSETIKK